MGGKGCEVLGLKLLDDSDGEVGLDGEGEGLSSIVGSVSEFLAHKTVRVMSIVGTFSDVLISLEICRSNQCQANKF